MSAALAVLYFLDEEPRPTINDRVWTCSGWIFRPGQSGGCAVRVRNSQRATLACYGQPREDVARSYPESLPAATSGFRVDLVDFGRRPVVLEWLDESGHWQVFWRETIAAAGRRPRFASRSRLPASHLLALGREIATVTRAAPWRSAGWAAKDAAVDYCCEDSIAPTSQDLIAQLDGPSDRKQTSDFLPISGWVFHPARSIRRLYAAVDPGGSVHLIYPKPRADVAVVHARRSAPIGCGFTGLLKLPAGAPRWFHLRLYAVLADGSERLVCLRRYFRAPPAESRPPLLRAGLLLGALVLLGRCRPTSWAAWARECLHSWMEAAPPPVPTRRKVHASQPQPPTISVAVATGDPLISLIVPVYNTPPHYLVEMIASVQAQHYPRWELCLADDASTDPHLRPLLEEFARADPRIRPVFRAENGHIARASNTALAQARGEFVALLDHDDLLAPAVLHRVVELIRARPAAQFIYTNRDKVDDQGRHFDPEERGAWNPAMALTHNYLHHLTVIRRQLVLRAGAFRPDYYGSQDLDLYLRCHELLQPHEICHVPIIGYHWRAHAGSTASRGDQKDYMFDSARRGIEDALRRRGLRAQPFLPAFGTIYGMNLHQLRWDPAILREQSVSIVVVVPPELRDGWSGGLARLQASIPGGCSQIIVVADDAPTRTDPGRPAPEFIPAPAGTNRAARYNLGAAHARHPLLLLLAPRLCPVSAGWLEDLAGWLSVPGVAAAGPKLVADDGLLSSAGWSLNPMTGLPQALFAGDPVDDLIPPFLAHSARDALLLDPACLLTPTAVFRELGGFAETVFPERHYVADYCLRLHGLGRRVVFSPQAVLGTHEPAPIPGPMEDECFRQRHGAQTDPWVFPAASMRGRTMAAQSSTARRPWMPAETVEFAAGWFYLEHPLPGMVHQAGHQVLTGWCLLHPGKYLADFRVRIGPDVYPAVLGYPRPDLAAWLGDADRLLPAGFSLELALPAGPARLVFEARVAGQDWEPVSSALEWEVLPVRAPSRPVPPGALTLAQWSEAMGLLLRPPTVPTDVEPLDATTLAHDAAVRGSKRHADRPFHGYIDQPAPTVVPAYGRLIVTGWLCHETQAIRRVVASFDLTHWLDLRIGGASEIIAGKFPHIASAVRCAIHGFVHVPTDQPQPLALHVWAQLADGSWHLVFFLRCRAVAVGMTDPVLLAGVTNWTLLRTAWSLHWALWRRRVRGPGWRKVAAGVMELRRKLPAPARQVDPPLPHYGRPARPRLLLVTHNLNREGAPLFLLELARYCLEHGEVELTVFSPDDGALRRDYAALGAEVRILPCAALWAARTAAETDAALGLLGRELRPYASSLVVANTIECFWAVRAAQRVGRPSLFYIHEPGVLGFHYLGHCSPHVGRAAAATLAQATCVSFPNAATRAYYLAYSTGTNYRVQPGWTDRVAGREPAGRAQRSALRSRLGFAPQERIVINVGTVCPRKGQAYFVQAVEQLWQTQPELAATCRFLLIGYAESDYGAGVTALIARLGRPNLALVPSTSAVQDYFEAADQFVLSSFEEGFSRVLLEAMSCGLPIVSTAIHGIPELVRPGREALLVPPGDTPALAAAMQRLLQDELLATSLGRNARERLETNFTAARVLPQHLATIRTLAPDLPAAESRIPAPDLPELVCTAS